MLEPPDLPSSLVLSALQREYGLHNAQVTFLPLGYDVNTAVYRVVAGDGTAYFLKLRKGAFDETLVTAPQFLSALGNRAIIAPLATRTRQYWGGMGIYKMILYPFIEGENGFRVELTDPQRIAFGAALKGVHTAQLPPDLRSQIQSESYSRDWREQVKTFQAQMETASFDEPVAAKLAALMRVKRAEISHVVGRAEELCLALQARSLEFVLCHSDMHAGNLLISPDGALYIVDWDNPILAPKERDLMFIGGGVDNQWPTAREESLFYLGYGPAQIDRTALAYYRYERIVQDMAAFCEQLLSTTAGGEDREQSFQYFASNFLPGQTIDIAANTFAKIQELA